MLAQFKKHIRKHFPDLFTDRIAIAISGGLDSCVLAHLLWKLEISFDLIHCNFNLRGEESDGDERFVAQLAQTYQSTFHSNTFNTRTEAKKRGVSIQMAARDLRYQYFNEVAAAHNIHQILTAHHIDDQLETFLINLGRKSGLDGLTGIKDRNGNISRPLLPFTREQIKNYAIDHQIQWREDSSNSSTDYMRNKLRHDVLPILHEALPDLRSNFQDSLNHLKNSNGLVKQEVARFRESGTTTNKKGTFISIAALKETGNPEAYLNELVKEFQFNLPDVSQLLNAENGKRITSGRMLLWKDRDHLILKAVEPSSDFLAEVHESNPTILLDTGTLHLKTIETADALAFVRSNHCTTKLFLDLDEVSFPLTIRTWKTGDRMQPFGMKGSKLISDVLTDQKISSLDREKALVLKSGNKIIWLIGKRSSNDYIVTPKTKTILEITLEL